MPTTAAKKTTITLRIDPALQARIEHLVKRHPVYENDDVLLRILLRAGLTVKEREADAWCAEFGEPAPEAPAPAPPLLPLLAGHVIDFGAASAKLRRLRERGR